MSFPLPPLARRRDTDFDVGILLGRGTFTSVYASVEKATGRRYAMKVVDRYRCERLKKTADVFMEKHCLQRTNHCNIIKMLGWFSDNTNIYVMLEECLGGELWEVIKTVGCPVARARYYFAQLINAVSYLRDARIVHRDLKAENVMLTELGVVKLIDFGTAKDLENPQIKGAGNASRHKVFEDYVGTPQFMPKEVIENKCSDHRSDIWSLGCTFFQVLSGCPPFHDRSEYLIFQRVMALDLVFPPGIDPDAHNLITQMVVEDADARLGAANIEDVKNHPFFQSQSFEAIHEKPVPMVSLADLCLQRIGNNMKEFTETLPQWSGASSLVATLREQLDRMQMAHKWQEDVLPPEDAW
ncbi:PDPK2 [Symbiodinium pilosum]|uniref:PDPK2 protein n=1 Tax=Symbiodinium pilosum TaxID=2952 RepID=A0A812YD46_SYMPI|nr:PDPK2 [Symbiodinium pilosum]